MQRLLFALVALLSFFTLAMRPAQAQNEDAPVDPTASPQRIDRAASGTSPSPAETMSHPTGDTVQIGAGETKDNVSVQDQSLILEGKVKHDVVAVQSDVTVKPGAQIGGHLVLFGGHLHNEAGNEIRVVRLQPETASAFSGANTGLLTVPPKENPAASVAEQAPHKGSWFGAQVALLAFGLLSALVVMAIAPRGAQQASTRMDQQPGRCLLVGGIGVAIGLLIALVNAAIMHSAIWMLYAPVGAIVALAPLVLLTYGWLCGMRCAGDFIARRFGRHGNGLLYSRIALGLGAFCLVNLIFGENLGVVGVVAEFLIAVMGLGAVMITGGGTEPDWLDARLRGETRWFSRGHRW